MITWQYEAVLKLAALLQLGNGNEGERRVYYCSPARGSGVLWCAVEQEKQLDAPCLVPWILPQF